MDCVFCYHVFVMLVSNVAFCLIWVGFGTPGWLVTTFQETIAEGNFTVSSLNRSLFYAVICPQELKDCTTCVFKDIKDCIYDMNYPGYKWHYDWLTEVTRDYDTWLTWQVTMGVVGVSCFIGWLLVLVLVCCLLKPNIYRSVAIIALVCWLLGGLLVFVPVGMVAHMHLTVEDEIDNNVPHDATLHTPYSLIVAAVGGFLAILTAIMLIWFTGCCQRHYESDIQSTTSDIITKYSSTPYNSRGLYGPKYYSSESPTFIRDKQSGGYLAAYPGQDVIDYPNRRTIASGYQTSGYPTSAYPTSGYPTVAYPDGAYPTGAYPARLDPGYLEYDNRVMI